MTRFTFIFLDGGRVSIDAAECKHYSGHAALTDVTAIDGHPHKHKRFNVGLYGLRYMYPEDL